MAPERRAVGGQRSVVFGRAQHVFAQRPGQVAGRGAFEIVQVQDVTDAGREPRRARFIGGVPGRGGVVRRRHAARLHIRRY